MRIARVLGFACCLLTFCLLPSAAAGAVSESEDIPEPCYEEGDLGKYIVGFHDWVEDPTALAHEQTERYGGNLTHIYTSAKGYAAELPPQSVPAIQAEPTVASVGIDSIMWIVEEDGIYQFHGCLGAPPIDSDPPEEPEGDEPSRKTVPANPLPAPPLGDESATGVQQVGGPASHRAHRQRRGCKKRKGRGRAPAVARCPKRVG